MRHIAAGLVIGSLMLGGMALPAEARGGHRGHHGHHQRHHGHGHFFGGFLAGAATVVILDALTTPHVVYEPGYYRGPVCRDVWIPKRWEVHTRHDNGFTTYYNVLVPGTWQRQCY